MDPDSTCGVLGDVLLVIFFFGDRDFLGAMCLIFFLGLGLGMFVWTILDLFDMSI